MPTVDFGDCLANYWFVWTINGLGSIFRLAINMAISYFFLKYFHSIQGKTSSSSTSATATSASASAPAATDASFDSLTNS